MVSRPLVSVVDDDESVRDSLPDLLREFGFEVETFASAEEFLASDRMEETDCLILDIAMVIARWSRRRTARASDRVRTWCSDSSPSSGRRRRTT